MLAKSPLAIFPALSPDNYARHPLHEGSRDWPETNCYLDVWIEILHAMGEDPTAALGFTVAQDFEGDHFTFSKFPLEDLHAQFGLDVRELALYDSVEAHVIEQTRRGRMVLVEVDGFFLPDTRGVSYGLEHAKTTIAINRVDPNRRELGYFHGAGFHALAGDDYRAVMSTGARFDGDLLPYAERVDFERRRTTDAECALALLRRHITLRPARNPVAAFRERVRDQAEAAAARPNAFLHKYAFNTARQLGMNFGLLGSHLAWLDGRLPAPDRFGPAVESCQGLSSGAKAFQFQLARAVARKRFDGLEPALAPLVDHHTRLMDALAAI